MLATVWADKKHKKDSLLFENFRLFLKETPKNGKTKATTEGVTT
jgi:hypothetical protein